MVGLNGAKSDESGRWAQMRAGTLPPIELTLEERLDDLVQEAYTLLEARQTTTACDRWLEDRRDVLERLAQLYGKWGRPEERVAVLAQLDQLQEQPARSSFSAALPKSSLPGKKPGRNAPCWCGSGKKYKKCHLHEDEEKIRGAGE